MIETANKTDLLTDGYVILHSAIDREILADARRRVEGFAHRVTIDAENLPNGYGLKASELLKIVNHAEATLKALGATPTWLTQMVLIPKFAHEKRRYWHTDVMPVLNKTPNAGPPETVFVQYYLDDTTADNGCLVIMPRHIENFIANDYGAGVGEYALPVEAGDVIVMDPRIAHATRANNTDQDRLLIRLQIEIEWSN